MIIFWKRRVYPQGSKFQVTEHTEVHINGRKGKNVTVQKGKFTKRVRRHENEWQETITPLRYIPLSHFPTNIHCSGFLHLGTDCVIVAQASLEYTSCAGIFLSGQSQNYTTLCHTDPPSWVGFISVSGSHWHPWPPPSVIALHICHHHCGLPPTRIPSFSVGDLSSHSQECRDPTEIHPHFPSLLFE